VPAAISQGRTREEARANVIAHGVTVVRHGGKHDVWRRPDREATVPGYREIKPGTARSVCEQLRIPIPPER
jgi:predicted RNA binding protein YcfA (HicA-like mRNA interferase family)